MRIAFWSLCLLLVLMVLPLVAQDNNTDSLAMPFDLFIQEVEQKHPIAKQIRLATDFANFQLMEARGQQLDPQLEGKWKFKQFDGDNYYNIYDAYLRIPTSWGIDIKAGYNGAEGYYLNPENNLPDAGQAYLGVSVPLLQGLWNNERQTALRMAKLMKDQAPVKIQAELNNLFYEAAKAYWMWTEAFNRQFVFKQNLELAEAQFQQIKSLYLQGDLPAIDTLKSFIQIQDFQILFLDAQLEERQSRWMVENYLWTSDSTAAQLPLGASPLLLSDLIVGKMDSSNLEAQLARLDQHPDLRLYQFKLDMLEFERRFKQTKVLPKANVEYNFLSANNVNFFENTGGIAAVTENYKLGLKLSYPILIREARAGLELNRIKQQDTRFKLNFKKQEISTKIRSYFNKMNSYADQIALLQINVENYFRLVEAEREKFALGESDIFLINTRQQQYVAALLKLYKTQIKFLKARTAWSWATANW
jgi:outer membrane protein TolC